MELTNNKKIVAAEGEKNTSALSAKLARASLKKRNRTKKIAKQKQKGTQKMEKEEELIMMQVIRCQQWNLFERRWWVVQVMENGELWSDTGIQTY